MRKPSSSASGMRPRRLSTARFFVGVAAVAVVALALAGPVAYAQAAGATPAAPQGLPGLSSPGAIAIPGLPSASAIAIPGLPSAGTIAIPGQPGNGSDAAVQQMKQQRMQQLAKTPAIPDARASDKNGFFVFNYYNSIGNSGIQPWELRCTEFTHLVWSFANVLLDGTVTLEAPPSAGFDNKHLAEQAEFPGYKFNCKCEGTCLKGQLGVFGEMKQRCQHMRLIMSVGGLEWSRNFSSAVAQEATRSTFISTSTALLINYGFDGIDIDWQLPGQPRAGDPTYKYSPADLNNLAHLYKEMRAFWSTSARGSSFIITMALDNKEDTGNKVWPRIASEIDFGLLMGQDYLKNSNRTRPASALYASKSSNAEEQKNTVSAGLLSYIAAGFQPEKLVLGIPLSATGWSGLRNTAEIGIDGLAGIGLPLGPGVLPATTMPYIALMALSGDWVVQHLRQGVAVVRSMNTIYFTDTPLTVRQKTAYALRKNLGGVMLWNTNLDDPAPQLSLGAAAANATSLNRAKISSSCMSRRNAHFCNLACVRPAGFNSGNSTSSPWVMFQTRRWRMMEDGVLDGASFQSSRGSHVGVGKSDDSSSLTGGLTSSSGSFRIPSKSSAGPAGVVVLAAAIYLGFF